MHPIDRVLYGGFVLAALGGMGLAHLAYQLPAKWVLVVGVSAGFVVPLPAYLLGALAAMLVPERYERTRLSVHVGVGLSLFVGFVWNLAFGAFLLEPHAPDVATQAWDGCTWLGCGFWIVFFVGAFLRRLFLNLRDAQRLNQADALLAAGDDAAARELTELLGRTHGTLRRDIAQSPLSRRLAVQRLVLDLRRGESPAVAERTLAILREELEPRPEALRACAEYLREAGQEEAAARLSADHSSSE